MMARLTQSARTLRRRQTDAERKLWYRLRDRRLQGIKFRRQVPRGPYIVDFLSIEAALVIEVDGGQHAEARAKHDEVRTRFLEQQGLKVLRFWNNEVLGNIEGVLISILQNLPDGSSPSPGASRHPLPEGRGEGCGPSEEQGR